MAVKNRVAGGQIAIAATAENQFGGERRTRPDRLRIEITALVAVGIAQPLMCVMVMDVMHRRARVQHAETYVIAEVGVIHVGRIVGIKRARGFFAAAGFARIGRIERQRIGVELEREILQLRRCAGRVGRHIDHQRRIADRPRAQEKFLELALRAIRRRTHADAIRQHFGRDAADAVIDRERIRAGIVARHLAVGRVHEIRKRLHHILRLVIHHRHFAERLAALGQHRIVARAAGELAAIRAGDDRGQIGVDDAALAIEHAQNRRARMRVAEREHGVVIDLRMTIRHRAARGELEVGLRHLAAIPLAAARLHGDHAEQAGGELHRVEVVVLRGGAGEQVGAFFLREQAIHDGHAGRDEAAHLAISDQRILADPGAIVGDAFDRLQAGGMDRCIARHRLHRIFLLRIEQVGECDLEAAAGIDTQHHRARTFVRSQHHLAGAQIAVVGIGRNHVRPQRENFAIGARGAEPVDLKRLIQRDHIRLDHRFATLRDIDCTRVLAVAEQKKQRGEKIKPGYVLLHGSPPIFVRHPCRQSNLGSLQVGKSIPETAGHTCQITRNKRLKKSLNSRRCSRLSDDPQTNVAHRYQRDRHSPCRSFFRPARNLASIFLASHRAADGLSLAQLSGAGRHSYECEKMCETRCEQRRKVDTARSADECLMLDSLSALAELRGTHAANQSSFHR